MTQTLSCKINSSFHHYDIEIGRGLLTSQDEYLNSLAVKKFAVITDDRIALLYGKEFQRYLSFMGLEADLFTFPSGERYKTRDTKEILENQLFEKEFGRDSCVIALGGGVVTDLAGFIAATYCRGIPLVMIPTSLLAMVDASIGGKTGVNVPDGKNRIGCIFQPKKVIIDLYTLKTLPKKDIANGVVEIIKHGLVADIRLFELVETHVKKILDLDLVILEKLIFHSCDIKKRIVEEDEKERGKRTILNFGHTIGHALEQLSDFSISHGEAVAIGLLVESYLSLKSGILDQKSFDRIKRILREYGLPLQLPSKFPLSMILNTIALDKKSLNGRPRFVMIDGIGSSLIHHSDYCTYVDESLIINALEWMNDDLCCHSRTDLSRSSSTDIESSCLC